MSEAAPIKVFVVRIRPKLIDQWPYRIGAVYLDEFAAIEECKRLRAANSYTLADYVVRELEADTITNRVVC